MRASQQMEDQHTVNMFNQGRTLAGTSQVVLVVKNLPVNAGDVKDVGSIPGSGRSPGGGHGTPLHYSCLRIPLTEERGNYSP